MHQEPDVGFDPGSPGSRPGPKAGAKRLRHPGIPLAFNLNTELAKEKIHSILPGSQFAVYDEPGHVLMWSHAAVTVP